MSFVPFRSSRIAYKLNSAFARSSCNKVVKNPLFVIVIVLLQFKKVPTGICVAQSYKSEQKSKKSESEHLQVSVSNWNGLWSGTTSAHASRRLFVPSVLCLRNCFIKISCLTGEFWDVTNSMTLYLT